MAVTIPANSVSSHLLQPVVSLLLGCKSGRKCNSMDDSDWVAVGVERCLQAHSSGRGFLQELRFDMPELCPELSHFFETLKSQRRLTLVSELNERIVDLGRSLLPNKLACFPCLDGFEVYASDGHFHEHACHDKRNCEGKVYAVGHLYSRNLRTGLVSHLNITDQIERKKEHDMRTLKRTSISALRQGAPTGVKVLHIYDRAGIDFGQWQDWKQGSGIYFLSRRKENMVLTKCGDLPFDRTDSVNSGVISDELVGPSNGYTMRMVTFHDEHTGRTFEYLTNLIDSKIPPGVIAQLYKMRWNIEKSFDEMKNKLGEQKAWASSPNAKQMQAQFICMTLNLVNLLAHELETKEGIINEPENKRRQKRTDDALAVELKAGLLSPPAWQTAQGPTQNSVKLYRWIAAHTWNLVLWSQACDALRVLYAHL